MRNNSRTVTDNCKYYCIYNAPINLAFLQGSKPFYDETDKYYIQSTQELQLLFNTVSFDAVKDFVNQICNLKAMGNVDAELMLKQIHQFSSKTERNTAFDDYHRWINSQYYTHLEQNEQGELERKPCTRYVAHSECRTKADPQVEYIRINRKYGIMEKSIQNYTGTRTEIKRL